VISVIVPVRNDPGHLRSCLESLAAARGVDHEVIVVDDASTDESPRVAEARGARVLRLDRRSGPAAARNRGAEAARGEHLLFVDADVCVHPETVGQVATAFAADPGIDALFGSYDRRPGAGNFLSQYKNLFHHFVHQQGSAEASTFWSGCGAIKRSVFLEMGGFDTSYGRPCIEDIELGARLRRAGRRIVLRKEIQATHLKRWTLAGIVKSDVWDRGVPWTELILRDRSLPDDLNLKLAQRLSAVLAYLLAATVVAAIGRPFGVALGMWLLTAAALLLAIVAINRRFYAFFVRERGLLFAVRVVPLHVLYYLYSGVALALGVARHVWNTKVRHSSKRIKVASGAPAP
jgi:cellulose synthase/poly-beta-1,6-N-acetylglucosamine synthase-like glycosyltransferase